MFNIVLVRQLGTDLFIFPTLMIRIKLNITSNGEFQCSDTYFT
jgi:hypothetical protein